MSRRTNGIVSLLAFGAGLACVSGCAQPRAEPPQVDIDTLDEDAFLGYLADVPMVSVDEAYRAVVILSEGSDPHQTFEQRRAWLEEQDIARPAWKLQRDCYIDQGAVAFMVCRVLQMRGGLDRILFGSWGLGDRRYAHRELVYRGLLATQGSDFAPITGGEFAHLLGMADEYMAARGVYDREPIELAPQG